MMILVVLAIIGAINASPYDDYRSDFEDFTVFDTNLDNPAYRLKDNVQPSEVHLDLDVYLAESRFTGVVRIVVQVLEANLAQIVLHQNVVSITAVTVVDSQNQPVSLQFPAPFETDSYYEILKINLATPIAIGNYTLTIAYNGRINENPLDRGFYKGYYYLNNQLREYATTQFQPYHARKAFPCFDEPQFKSQYVISITRDSSLSTSYSNMAINSTETVSTNRIRETFLPTPTISAYLLAFHVSDFVETTLTGTDAKPFGIISRQGATNQHAYAADIGLKITNELDDYLDYGYYTMGEGQPMKNDHIALPDFPSGAMENWGMVNYREAYLLYDEANTNLPNQITIATIMAHELAHKWFGNLVTCFWWSNLWINESYASFFEYFAAHYADASLELADQFVVDYVHSALNWDAGSPTPMNWTAVVDNPSITLHFSVTSYAKGASVLRMMEHFVGDQTFRNALRYYIRDNAYGLGTPEDVYAGFRQAVSEDLTFAALYGTTNIGTVFDSWVQNPGSPVINVVVNTTTGVITLTQERFSLSGTAYNQLWQIPVSWTHGGSPNFDTTKPAIVMTGQTAQLSKPPGDEWVILNVAQSGLYRVNYDDDNWARIAAALRDEKDSIHKLNRAQLMNDVLYFLRAGKISVERAFDVLNTLKDETDYYVWAGALTQLDWIRRRLEHIPAAHEEFSEYLLELMDHVIDDLGYTQRATDSTSTILNRMLILNYACNNLGHEGCVAYSRERWEQYVANDAVLVSKNERRYVYCVGLREGGASDFNFLFQKYNTSENTADMVVILRALACTKDEASLQTYLEQTLFNDRIRLHDRPNSFTFALQGNKENLKVALNFLVNRFSDIEQHYGGVARLNLVINALATFLTDGEDITVFQNWLYTNQLSLQNSFNTGLAVIESSVNNIRWGNDNVVSLFSYLRSRNSASTASFSIAVVMATIVAHLLK